MANETAVSHIDRTVLAPGLETGILRVNKTRGTATVESDTRPAGDVEVNPGSR